MTAEATRVDAEKLYKFTMEALQKLGVPEEDARITARILIDADLRGIESHGVARLRGMYAKRIKAGIINLHPQAKIVSEAPSTATMDGDQGLGFVIGHRAMQEAMARAEKTGAGFVTVRNSTHFGAAGCYAMMALERDMIGIAMTNTAGTAVLSPDSLKSAFGTNPLAVAAPAGRAHPFVLDMATSVVAIGKVEIAQREGKHIPEGWLVDREGKPITDPTKRVWGEGGQLPLGGTAELGGYKGFGLGILVDVLCGVLSGGSATILRKKSREQEEILVDHFFGALRIDGFMPLEKFKKIMDEMIETLEALPKVPGVEKIYVAGGPEAELVRDRKANGIPLYASTITALRGLAEELGIEYSL